VRADRSWRRPCRNAVQTACRRRACVSRSLVEETSQIAASAPHHQCEIVENTIPISRRDESMTGTPADLRGRHQVRDLVVVPHAAMRASRSVIMPTTCPLSSTTGTAPDVLRHHASPYRSRVRGRRAPILPETDSRPRKAARSAPRSLRCPRYLPGVPVSDITELVNCVLRSPLEEVLRACSLRSRHQTSRARRLGLCGVRLLSVQIS